MPELDGLAKVSRNLTPVGLPNLTFLRDRYNEAVTRQSEWEKLADILLNERGLEVVACFEESLAELLDRGRFFSANNFRANLGRPSECHRNCSNLWENNPGKYQIVTGWALCDDELWRQHTWLLEKGTKQGIETTAPRQHYFGYLLTESEAQDFCFDNL